MTTLAPTAWTETEHLLRSAQRSWASAQLIGLDQPDRVERLDDNLFQAMNSDTPSEFESGDGSELGTSLAPGMYSLILSSALCCNVLDRRRGPVASGAGNYTPALTDPLYRRSLGLRLRSLHYLINLRFGGFWKDT